jgi:hypothetical protein
MRSSFYGDFEKFDNEEDESDDDEDDEDSSSLLLDGKALAEFRNKMDFLFEESDSTISSSSSSSAVDELIDYARKTQGGSSPTQDDDSCWAKVATSIAEGVVLLANPSKFCADVGLVTPSPALLSKFGLICCPC